MKISDKEHLEQKRNGLIIVKGEINDHTVKILLDTGSSISLIREQTLNKINNLSKNITKIPRVNLIGINERTLGYANRAVAVTIKLSNFEIDTQLLVVNHLEYDILLGSDELDRNNFIIDFEMGEIRIEGKLKLELCIEEVDDLKIQKENQILSIMNIGDDEKRESEVEVVVDSINQINVLIDNNINNLRARKINNVYDRMNSLKEEGNRNGNYDSRDIYRPKYANDGVVSFELGIDCDKEWKMEVIGLIHKYVGLVNEEARVARSYIHEIEIRDMGNFKSKSYPVPYKYLKEVNEELEKLLHEGIISYSTTSFINPVVIVRKGDNSIRLCLDARNLNQCTIPQYESPLDTQAILGRITNTKIFSKLDLKHSFWLIPLHENSRHLVGFKINGRVYEFNVVPFGIQSATSSLLKALNKILQKHESYTIHYVDDILIFSDNINKHLEHLNNVLHDLDEAGLKLNIQKCVFFKTEVVFLGYKLTPSTIEMDPSRIALIKEYKRPTNLKTLRGFLGILNYFKRLVPDFSEKLLPLVNLLKKNVKWCWTSVHEQAFADIKNSFHDSVKIFHPMYDQEFVLITDASVHRIAGVLLQEQQGMNVPISFVSRLTKPAEKNYSICELELLSIIFCINKLRYFLLGGHFTILTDNQALTTILKNKFNNARVHRWSLLLQEYTFTIKYLPGSENSISDAITRMDGKKINSMKTHKVGLNILKHAEGIFSLEAIMRDQEQLSEREKSKGECKNNIWIKLCNGLELYMITENLTRQIIDGIHVTYNHTGIRKTHMIFRENYFSKNDLSVVKQQINKCRACQFCKDRNNKNYNLPKSIVAEGPLDIVSIDFISNLVPSKTGAKHVFVLVDCFSKYVKLYPTAKTNKTIVKQLLENYISKHGKMKKLIMDNATYFNNLNLISWLTNKDIKPIFTSLRHPQSNLSERMIKNVLSQLKLMISFNHVQWEDKLNDVTIFLNHTPNISTSVAPIILFKQTEPIRPWKLDTDYKNLLDKAKLNLLRNAEKYKAKMLKRYNKPVTFNKGDLVLVKHLRVANRSKNICKKLLPYVEGPYEIINDNPINSYKLAYPGTSRIRGVFNIDQIYRYI